MISIGPFFVNSIIGGLIALPAALPVYTFENANILHYVLIYLGVSIAMHAFPSTGDAKSILLTLKDPDTSLLTKIVAYPLIGLIYVGSIGSFIWLDLAYGIGIAVGLPKLIISLA